MKRIKGFFLTTLLGGLLIVLPSAIVVLTFSWIYDFIRSVLAPLTRHLPAWLPQMPRLGQVISEGLSIALVVFGCFALGLAVKTRAGTVFFDWFERVLLRRIPGYVLVKETVQQFIGQKRSPFSAVVLARPYESDALVTAFVTDEHEGRCSVFVPTGPNPTSGNIFHLPKSRVYPVDVPVEEAMRSILSCGSGSAKLIARYVERLPSASPEPER